MTTPVHLDPIDLAVRARTWEALAASRAVTPTLTLRCAQCRQILAHAGLVPKYGPLFMSSWRALTLGAVAVNGEQVTERQLRQHDRRNGHEVAAYGPQSTDEMHGTIALLRLPERFAQDFPTLLVRCGEHGDAILERAEVLRWLSDPAPEHKVTVSFPLTEYVEPGLPGDHDPAVGETNRSVREVKHRPSTTA